MENTENMTALFVQPSYLGTAREQRPLSPFEGINFAEAEF